MGGPTKKREDESQTKLVWVRPCKLIFDPLYNVRKRFGDMKAFTDEVRAQGVKDPLTGYRKGDFIVVVSGHRRTMAAKVVEAEGREIWVPVMLEEQFYNPERRVMDLWTDNGSLPLLPLEQAEVLQRLINFGWTEEKIVIESGKSLVYVRRLKLLLSAPEKALQLVREERASATLVMDMMAEGAIDALLEKAENNALLPPIMRDDLFPELEVVSRPERITKADLKPNSWKVFKKWAPSVEEDKLPPEKLDAWKLMKKMLSGEATEKDFKKFFK